MKRASLCLLALFTAALAGCHDLTAAGAGVKVMTGDPPPACKEVGSVQGTGQTVADAKNDMRNQAADLGGNYVRMEAMGTAVGIVGTAYRCPDVANPATPAH